MVVVELQQRRLKASSGCYAERGSVRSSPPSLRSSLNPNRRKERFSLTLDPLFLLLFALSDADSISKRMAVPSSSSSTSEQTTSLSFLPSLSLPSSFPSSSWIHPLTLLLSSCGDPRRLFVYDFPFLSSCDVSLLHGRSLVVFSLFSFSISSLPLSKLNVHPSAIRERGIREDHETQGRIINSIK